MATFIKCGWLFDGRGETAASEQTIVVQDSVITFAGDTAAAPARKQGDVVVLRLHAKWCE